MSGWKKTGKPAHNNAVERSAEDEHEYEANPMCGDCGGSGMLWTESPVKNWEGDVDEIEYINEPCNCVFVKWELKPLNSCKQCNGTGAVQERLIHPDTGEEYIRFHDCVCLRYVQGGRKHD